jgi:type I restriction enzyme, S subunit
MSEAAGTTTPTSWRATTLGAVTSWASGGTPSKANPDFWNGVIPWLSAKSLKSFYLHDSDDRVTEAAVADGARLALPGDVLMLVRGMTLHHDAPVGIAMRPMTFNQDVKRIRGRSGADSSFIAYWLLAHKESLLAAVDQASHGTGRLQTDLLLSMQMRLPPEEEQRRITAVLTALDDKIEQNRQTAQALERLTRAIFRAWFVDFEPVKAKAAGAAAYPSMPQPVFSALPTRFVDSDIGPVPEGWEVKALSSICTLVGGGTPKRSEAPYWNGDVPWYSVKDAPDHGELWVIRTSERISTDGLTDSAARVVPKGSTIISARGTVGKLAMAGVPMAFNQSCYGLLPGDGKSFGYLHLLMQSVVADLQQRVHGSVFDTITRPTFDGLLVTSPHGQVVSTFESVVDPLLARLLASVRESSKLAAMRDYLLPKLLSGVVRVEVR